MLDIIIRAIKLNKEVKGFLGCVCACTFWGGGGGGGGGAAMSDSIIIIIYKATDYV